MVEGRDMQLWLPSVFPAARQFCVVGLGDYGITEVTLGFHIQYGEVSPAAKRKNKNAAETSYDLPLRYGLEVYCTY